ncbi:MAG: ABC transporter permease [Bacteroidia bacterium]|nr:ABC transporter permease [Bacteroidia bacterium]
MLWLNIFRESLLFAITALRVNKLRTMLSLLGITIGIFAIISVFTVVDSLEKNLRDGIKSLGDNVVFVEKWPWAFGPNYPWWKYLNRPVPNVTDMENLMERSRKAEAVAFTLYARTNVKAGSSTIENADIVIVSHDYYRVQALDIGQGRYFAESESESGRPVCIIGDNVARALFPNKDPLAETVRVRGSRLKIIGVFERKGESLLGNNVDNQVLVPINFARNLVDLRSDNFDPRIMVKALPGISNDELKDELTGIMRSLHKLKPLAEDDFALNETSLISNQFDEIFDVVGTAGWIIGAFAILVGGFGIANIMFVSVKERTNQIGVQKSLGARNSFILSQFLFESVLLCLLGGLVGLFFVFLITGAVSSLMEMDISLSRANVILGLTISVIIGIVSGFVPAYSASQLDPVEAIRSN